MFSNLSGYWSENQISEWGGELIDTEHKTIHALARRFKLRLENLIDAQPKGSEETYRFFDRYYAKRTADRDFVAMSAALHAETKAAPIPETFEELTEAARTLDRMSVHAWIESRVPGGHRSPLGQLLDVAYTIEYGADTNEQSALNLVYMLGSQPDKTGQTLSLLGESDERFHIRGGNEQLPKAIAAHLDNDTLQFNMALTGLRKRASGAYRLQFDNKGAVHSVEADFVVLALPFAVLRNVDLTQAEFDERKMDAIREQGMARNAKMQLQFRERPWRQSGPWPGRGNGTSYADTGYQSSWEVTRAQPGTGGILNFFLGGTAAASLNAPSPFATARQRSVFSDAERLLSSAEKVFPGLSPRWNHKATLSLWQLHPWVRGSYSFYRVGQYARFFGYEKARQGNVLFCGEHTSTNFQGFMEGGASEGFRAAAELLQLLPSWKAP